MSAETERSLKYKRISKVWDQVEAEISVVKSTVGGPRHQEGPKRRESTSFISIRSFPPAESDGTPKFPSGSG